MKKVTSHYLAHPFLLSVGIAALPLLISFIVSLMSFCGLERDGICWLYFYAYLVAETLQRIVYAPVISYLDFVHFNYFTLTGIWFTIILCVLMYFVVFVTHIHICEIHAHKAKRKNK